MKKVLHYPDNVSDKTWALIEPYLTPSYHQGGRPLRHSKRLYFNALLYWLRTGCQWRYLPHDFPPWQSVYTQFRRWQELGVFERLAEHLRQTLRVELGHSAKGTSSIVDSQSVKTAEMGRLKGYDGAKKVKGRKRHILVDNQGFLVASVVGCADENARKGLAHLLNKLTRKGLVLKKNLR